MFMHDISIKTSDPQTVYSMPGGCMHAAISDTFADKFAVPDPSSDEMK